jgi:hypothetical protein
MSQQKSEKGRKREKQKCTHGDMEEVVVTTVTLGEKLTLKLLKLVSHIVLDALN